MEAFYLSLSVNDILTATYYYNEMTIGEREVVFINILSRKNDNLTESLLPLTPSSVSIIDTAIRYGNYTVVSRLFLNEYRKDRHLMILAATLEDSSIMRFLHQRRCIWSQQAFCTILTSSSLECLKYAVEVIGVKLDYYAFSIATKRPTCRYYGIPPKLDITQYSKAELRVLQYLHDNNCIGDWDHNYKGRKCHFCLNRPDIQLQELWHMEEETYSNCAQWLPREMIEDVVGLL